MIASSSRFQQPLRSTYSKGCWLVINGSIPSDVTHTQPRRLSHRNLWQYAPIVYKLALEMLRQLARSIVSNSGLFCITGKRETSDNQSFELQRIIFFKKLFLFVSTVKAALLKQSAYVLVLMVNTRLKWRSTKLQNFWLTSRKEKSVGKFKWDRTWRQRTSCHGMSKIDTPDSLSGSIQGT